MRPILPAWSDIGSRPACGERWGIDRISPEDLAQLEATVDVLGDPAALADIREADEAYTRGDVVRGVEAVRQLRR
jgi:hypothetical protein